MRRPTSGRKRSTKRKVGAVKRKTTRRRKRGIGATNDVMGLAMKGVGIGTGIVVARVANNLIQKVATLSPLLSGVIQFGAGFAVSKMNKKGGFLEDMTNGIMGNGLSVTIVSLASGSPLATVINGPNDGRQSYYVMNGPGTRLGISTGQARQLAGAQLPAVAGAQLPVVAGHNRRRTPHSNAVG